MKEHVFGCLKIDGQGTMPATVAGDEVVRCKDCLYWRDEDFCANPQWQTGGPSNGLISFPCTFPEDFCSYAEPKEES